MNIEPVLDFLSSDFYRELSAADQIFSLDLCKILIQDYLKCSSPTISAVHRIAT